MTSPLHVPLTPCWGFNCFCFLEPCTCASLNYKETGDSNMRAWLMQPTGCPGLLWGRFELKGPPMKQPIAVCAWHSHLPCKGWGRPLSLILVHPDPADCLRFDGVLHLPHLLCFSKGGNMADLESQNQFRNIQIWGHYYQRYLHPNSGILQLFVHQLQNSFAQLKTTTNLFFVRDPRCILTRRERHFATVFHSVPHRSRSHSGVSTLTNQVRTPCGHYFHEHCVLAAAEWSMSSWVFGISEACADLIPGLEVSRNKHIVRYHNQSHLKKGYIFLWVW